VTYIRQIEMKVVMEELYTEYWSGSRIL